MSADTEEVVYNHLLLEQIFAHISGIRDLKKTSRVCKLWRDCCDREVRRRCNRHLIDHLFYGFPVETMVSSDSYMITNNGDKPFVMKERQNVIQRLCDYYKNQIQFTPDLVIMFNAKLNQDMGWHSALKVDKYRKYLPKECRFVHLDSQTVIGTSAHNGCPFPAGNGLAGISHLLLPKISGINVHIYKDQEICQSLKADSNIKCILYFESSKDFDKKDSSGNYIWNNCNHHMWDVMKEMKYKVAFGGTRVAAVDLSDGYQARHPDKPFACIVISGRNVSACSLEMKTGSSESTERLLKDFKSQLDFDADDTKNSTTFAFVFCRVIPFRFDRYCHFKEGQPSQLVHKIFPNVVFIGAISVMNFGHNYWPGLAFKSDEDSNYRTTHFDSSIIVLINVRNKCSTD